MFLWNQYLREVEKQIGKASCVSWRNKQTGWHDSWNMCLGEISENGEECFRYTSRWSKGDLFYRFFLGNYCLGRACYGTCKYKMASSAADIRIGDLWGTVYEKDQKGVSAVLALTDKGKALVRELHHSCHFEQRSGDIVMEGQMRVPPARPYIRKIIIRQLANRMTLANISTVTLRLYYMSFLPKRAFNKLIKIVKWAK